MNKGEYRRRIKQKVLKKACRASSSTEPTLIAGDQHNEAAASSSRRQSMSGHGRMLLVNGEWQTHTANDSEDTGEGNERRSLSPTRVSP